MPYNVARKASLLTSPFARTADLRGQVFFFLSVTQRSQRLNPLNKTKDQEEVKIDMETLEKRPGFIMVGSQSVGKRTLLSRLFPVDFEDAPNPSSNSSELLAYGWTINTKYYTADVSVWMAHLHDEFSISSLPMADKLSALVMVFNVNDHSSFAALKKWVKQTDIQKFDILLCIGNKVDLLPHHPAHAEYRRCLLKREESSGSSSLEYYGISETEGSSLLGDEPSSEISKSCLEWCIEYNIEYIEACASNAYFDKCLSVDGDSQGVERLYGALSAHTWPGMALKFGNKINEPSLPEKEDLSEEESEYELEYEVLSTEPWDDTDGWMSADGPVSTTTNGEQSTGYPGSKNFDCKNEVRSVREELEPSTLAFQLQEELDRDETPEAHEADRISEPDEGKAYDFEDLTMLMSEIGNMRSSLRLMPDFQRREIAAKLAMKMAATSGDSSGGEEGFD